MKFLIIDVVTILWLTAVAPMSYSKNNEMLKKLSVDLVPLNLRDLRRTMSGMNECLDKDSQERYDAPIFTKIESNRATDISIKFLSSSRKNEIDKIQYIIACNSKVSSTNILAGGLMHDWEFEVFEERSEI